MRLGVPNRSRALDSAEEKVSLLPAITAALSYSTADFAQYDYTTSDGVLETEDARTEHGLPKIWIKLAHAYAADTRLSSSCPSRVLLESLGTRLGGGGGGGGVGGGEEKPGIHG